MRRLAFLAAVLVLIGQISHRVAAEETEAPHDEHPSTKEELDAKPRIVARVEILQIDLSRHARLDERLECKEWRQISATNMLEIASVLSGEDLPAPDRARCFEWLVKQKLARRLIGPVQVATPSGETTRFVEGGETRVPDRGEMATVEFGTRVDLFAKATEARPLTLVVSPQLTVMDTRSALRIEGREHPGFKRSTIRVAAELLPGETAYFWGPQEEQQFWTDTDSPEGPKAEWQDPTRREGVRILMSLTAETAHGPPR